MCLIVQLIKLHTIRLKTPPETLDQLGESLLLLDQLQGEMKATENEFEPLRYIYAWLIDSFITLHYCVCLCRDMFKILGKYEVMIPEEDEVKLEGLPNAWMNFQQCLIDSTAMMKKYKVT